MSHILEPIPQDAIATKAGILTDAWSGWLQTLIDWLIRAPYRMSPTINLETQGGSIAATDGVAIQHTGLYRISNYVQVTRAATTSSSINAVFMWVTGGVTQTGGFGPLATNTTTTRASVVVLVPIDAGTVVTYSTTYASVGGTSMLYRMALIVERIDA